MKPIPNHREPETDGEHTKRLIDMSPDATGALQDGMLQYFLFQIQSQDTNVEHALEVEPFDYRDLMKRPPKGRK